MTSDLFVYTYLLPELARLTKNLKKLCINGFHFLFVSKSSVEFEYTGA